MRVLEVEKKFHLKETADEALQACPDIKKCLVVKYTGKNKLIWLMEETLMI